MKSNQLPPRMVRQKSEKIRKKAGTTAVRQGPAPHGRLHATAAPSPEPGDPIPQMELFQREDCPFSQAVRSALSELGVDFIARSVAQDNPLLHERLVEAGGKDQIPFLYDRKTGTRLYETSAILAYLEKVYGKPAKSLGQRSKRKKSGFFQKVEERLTTNSDRIAWALRAPSLITTRWLSDTGDSARSLWQAMGILRDALIGPIPTPPPREETQSEKHVREAA